MEAATSSKEVNGSSNIVACVPSKPRYYHGGPLRALSCLLECLGIEAFKTDLHDGDDSSSSSFSSSGDNQQGEAAADPPAPTLEPTPSSPLLPAEESAVIPVHGKRPRPPPVVTGPPQHNSSNS